VLERVPVTRVYNASPLDVLGLPVWAAVTPLASDLTVHAGKGATDQAARISAVMEAVERVSAEAVDPARERSASFAELVRERPDAVLDPVLLDLPFETTYEPHVPITWIEGYDLVADCRVWVPLDAVISPAREGVCAGVETNGLAAGNTVTEAVVHALYEVIERDALAHEQFAELYLEPTERPAIRLIDNDSLPAPSRDWASELRSRGMRVSIRRLSHDIGVPVFRATISDGAFPGRSGRPSRFGGMGCDLEPERALARAILEAAQSHTAVLVGARETFEAGPRPARRSAAWLVQQLLAPSAREPFAHDDDGDPSPDDLYERLRILLDRVQRAGLGRCIVVDLTREDLGIPVVRVLVPGLAGPYGETSRRPTLRLLRGLL
jgi:YcaO-like protein with predicted kinase domain